MSIEIRNEHRRAIEAHGEQTYPHECCGLILGHVMDGTKLVEEIKPLENAWVESPHNRSLIPSDQVLKCDRYARERGFDIIGFYHSHPNVAARPSEFDREHALPWWSYVIVSVVKGKAAELHSWVLRDDRSQFDQEEIITEEESTHGS
jgi:proteasome lid subunit RPN8/RPN11